MKISEKISLLIMGIVISLIVAYLFYNSALFVIPLLVPVEIIIIKSYGKMREKRRLRQIEGEFEEMLDCLAGALRAGYSLDNAFVECRKELVVMYGDTSLLVKELNIICHGLKMNIPIEKLVYNMAAGTRVRTISEFAQVLAIAKRTGGDFVSVIRQNADAIRSKRLVLDEIETMIAAKKYENLIMNLMPPGMILYLRITSPEYTKPLYNNVMGICIMTLVFIIYIAGIYFGARIMDIDKEESIRYPSMLRESIKKLRKSGRGKKKKEITIYEHLYKTPFARKMRETNKNISLIMVNEYNDEVLNYFWKELLQKEIICILISACLVTYGFLCDTGNLIMYILIGIVLVVGLPYSVVNSIKNTRQKRENQMLVDYPEIISKFSILLGAGLTMKNSLKKIADDYKKLRSSGNDIYHYVYEEIMYSCRQLEAGRNEADVYEQLGRRLKLLPYMKFMTMLVQNLKKGNQNLINQLGITSLDAINERRNALKSKGEKASSKLVFPMIVQFVMILVVIMYPALAGM